MFVQNELAPIIMDKDEFTLRGCMPYYDYQCLDCSKRFQKFLTYAEYGTVPVECPKCRSLNIRRRIGKIRVLRSDQSRMESLADPDNLADLDEDPRALGRMMRSMSHEVGEEMPPEFDEVVDRLEAGQNPDEIERSMPDLGESDSAGPSLPNFSTDEP
jgi:putative FmdB family regulatory protein